MDGGMSVDEQSEWVLPGECYWWWDKNGHQLMDEWISPGDHVIFVDKWYDKWWMGEWVSDVLLNELIHRLCVHPKCSSQK